MSQISLRETTDLLGKLLSERVPLVAFFASRSGVRVKLRGFVDSITRDNGLVVSVSGPPLDDERGYIGARPFDGNCTFLYGEKRELSGELQPLADQYGESALIVRFLDFGEELALFFTI